MNYILYIVVLFSGDSVVLNSQIFTSKKSCEDAQVEAIKQNESIKNEITYGYKRFHYRTWCQKQ